MNETFRDVKPGDHLSAREFNRLAEAVEDFGGEGPPNGRQRARLGGVSGDAQARGEFLMVRITGIVIPPSSPLYSDSLSGHVDELGNYGSAAFNAVLQVWDEGLKQWEDDPDGNGVDVGIASDAVGWRPLIVGDQIPVRWKRSAGIYVPLETRETAVVVLTGPADSAGFIPGVEIVFSSEAQAWVTLGFVYVIDGGF